MGGEFLEGAPLVLLLSTPRPIGRGRGEGLSPFRRGQGWLIKEGKFLRPKVIAPSLREGCGMPVIVVLIRLF